jgi:hypothetical protein
MKKYRFLIIMLNILFGQFSYALEAEVKFPIHPLGKNGIYSVEKRDNYCGMLSANRALVDLGKAYELFHPFDFTKNYSQNLIKSFRRACERTVPGMLLLMALYEINKNLQKYDSMSAWAMDVQKNVDFLNARKKQLPKEIHEMKNHFFSMTSLLATSGFTLTFVKMYYFMKSSFFPGSGQGSEKTGTFKVTMMSSMLSFFVVYGKKIYALRKLQQEQKDVVHSIECCEEMLNPGGLRVISSWS